MSSFFVTVGGGVVTQEPGMCETVFRKKWQQYAYHTLLHA